MDIENLRFIGSLDDITLPDPYPEEGDYRPIHPGIVTFDSPWYGFKYWMVYTPYPNGDNSFENPCIAASNDMKTWVAPGGLTNPIADDPGGTDYNADPDLFYDSNSDRLYVVYRLRTSSTNYLQMLSSPNGRDWSAITSIKSGPTSSQDFATPSLTYDGTNYIIYSINGDDAAAEKPVQRMTSSTIDSGWSAPATVTDLSPVNTTFWNLYVKYVDGGYVGFAQDAPSSGSAGDLFAISSSDGQTFTKTLVYNSTALYRCCFTLDTVNGDYLAFLSGVGADQWIRTLKFKLDKTNATEIREDLIDLYGKDIESIALHGDNFVRDDQAGVGTATNGVDPTGESGNWEISSDALQLSGAGNSKVWYDVSVDRCVVRTKFGAQGNDQWVMLRVVDTDNYIRIGQTGAGTVALQEVVGGSAGSLQTFKFLGAIAVDEELEILVTPHNFTIKALTSGGVSTINNSTLTNGTGYGMQVDGTGITFSYFTVSPYPEDDLYREARESIGSLIDYTSFIDLPPRTPKGDLISFLTEYGYSGSLKQMKLDFLRDNPSFKLLR